MEDNPEETQYYDAQTIGNLVLNKLGDKGDISESRYLKK